jgi:hypothetical protein
MKAILPNAPTGSGGLAKTITVLIVFDEKMRHELI